MSKLLIAMAMLLASIQPAVAAPGLIQTDLAGLEATQTQEDLEAHYGRGKGGAAIVGGIIGGIIGGLIVADQMDRQPYRPGRRVVCYAESFRGRQFSAVGSRARHVQQIALDKCYSTSRSCRPLGCEGRW